MKLQFGASQQFQLAAVAAVTDGRRQPPAARLMALFRDPQLDEHDPCPPSVRPPSRVVYRARAGAG